MDNLKYEPVTIKDLEELTIISVRAFHSDFDVGAPSKTGGPPGYDSVDFHKKMLNDAFAFFKILDSEKIIGGFWIFSNGKSSMELSRIFIDPAYHRKGIGLRAFRYLLRKYPHILKWTLDTPKWNIRTKSFYEKLGFLVEKEDNCFYYFVKTIK